MMEIEIIDRGKTWIYSHFREWMWRTSHLLFHLLDMILIDMHISEGMDESSCFHPEKVRKDMDEERIRSNIEWNTEEEIR